MEGELGQTENIVEWMCDLYRVAVGSTVLNLHLTNLNRDILNISP